MDVKILIIVGVIAVAGVLLLALMNMTRRGDARVNRAKYQSRWLAIQKAFEKSRPETYATAVLQADSLLDHALKERGFKGTTMGERMKSAKNVWSNANHVWSAHKVRNQIAHEVDVKITYELAARSLVAFKQGLKDLGAI